jgi:hypothetical protein
VARDDGLSRVPYSFHEVFGEYVGPSPTPSQRTAPCPFFGPRASCTKVSKAKPVGVCSVEDASCSAPSIVCPVRFAQGDIVWKDVASKEFGSGASFYVLREVELKAPPGGASAPGGSRRAAGRVDAVLAQAIPGPGGRPALGSFCFVETQAVYVSGNDGMTVAFNAWFGRGGSPSGRVPKVGGHLDFRSSQMKRLLPQVFAKSSIVKRWGRLYVVVDETFFGSFASGSPPTVCAPPKAQVVWMVYGLVPQPPPGPSRLELRTTVHTLVDDSIAALQRVGEVDEAASKDAITRKLVETVRAGVGPLVAP